MNNIDNNITIPRETLPKPDTPHYRRIVKYRKPETRTIKYTPALGNRIADLIIQGKTITYICKLKAFPSTNTFYKWCDEYPELNNLYKHARQLQARTMIDKAIEQPDKCLQEIRSLDVRDKRANAFVQAHKLIVDTNKDIAGLLNRAEFGRDVAAVASPAQIGVQVVFGKCQSQQDSEITEIKVVK